MGTIRYRELRRRYELDGPRKTVQHLSEALQQYQLQPEDFSIRDLAESLVPDGREWVRLMQRVVICETCDLYAVIGKFVETDLSSDELQEVGSRYALSPDMVAQLRQGAQEGKLLHETLRGS